MSTLRVVIADDERPARAYVRSMLENFDEVEIVGEAVNGVDAIALIEREQPDLALLDLQMPELDGLDVVKMIAVERMPLIAFITAYDEYAVKAFEVNAVDYLLKPVDAERLRNTLTRVKERLAARGGRRGAIRDVRSAVAEIEQRGVGRRLRRIPVRKRDDIFFVMVEEIASVVADGEILHLTTIKGERFVITYTLKELEGRLDGERFVRLSRSALVNIDAIVKVSPMPGGTFVVGLVNRQQVGVSRLRSRVLRETLLRL